MPDADGTGAARGADAPYRDRVAAPRAPLLRPPAVRPGDRVAVVAPSGVVDPDRLRRGVRWLGSLGLDVVVGRHALDRGGHGLAHLAGADADRAADLQDAWCDPRVAAVVVARGGTGAARLADLLDWAAMAAAGPRLLVGSSDATALHLAVGGRLGLASVFGPVAAGELLAGPEGPEPRSAEHLAQALMHPERDLVLTAAAAERPAPGPRRRVEAPLVGGTLSLLTAAVGTADQPSAAGAILVLEDVGEAPYRLDRALTHLRRCGVLDGVLGIACGDWAGCGPPADVRAVLVDRLGTLGVPLLLGLPFGHGSVQLSLPLGVTAVLDVSAGTLLVPPP